LTGSQVRTFPCESLCDRHSPTEGVMNYKVHEVSAEEMYFFDLRGYLVIPNVL
jgi:hypothetical protein